MLVSGVLYQDDNPTRNLQERVARCAALYFKKRGALPFVAYVHPSELNGQERAEGVLLVGHKTVLVGHYLLSGDTPAGDLAIGGHQLVTTQGRGDV